jgi:ribulose-5-phosphate 4-epimerase/fuculose-1-phosphate aldolase
MEFAGDGAPVDAGGRKPYSERFIHGAVYDVRPDVQSVVHHHSPSVIPFSVTGARLSPVMHMCAGIGAHIPTWDSRTSFGDTNLLVTNVAMAKELAAALGDRPVVLMRGHGCVVAGASLREVVFNSIYLQLNADLQMKAHALGNPTFLSAGEIAAVLSTRGAFTFERAWESWCRRAGRPYHARP